MEVPLDEARPNVLSNISQINTPGKVSNKRGQEQKIQDDEDQEGEIDSDHSEHDEAEANNRRNLANLLATPKLQPKNEDITNIQ